MDDLEKGTGGGERSGTISTDHLLVSMNHLASTPVYASIVITLYSSKAEQYSMIDRFVDLQKEM